MGDAPQPHGAVRLDLLKTLGDNTRYAIYLELARSPSPVTTAEIAETIGLHPNTVRPHLDRMREVGLVEVAVEARGQVGRPQHRYSIAADAPSLGFEPPIMPMLARLVTEMAAQLGADGADAEATGRTEGERRANRYPTDTSTLAAIVDDLGRLGFDPVVAGDPTDRDRAMIAFTHCPFGEIAEEHPKLVCNLHRGIIDGFLDHFGDVSLAEFNGISERVPCQAGLDMCRSASASPDGIDHG